MDKQTCLPRWYFNYSADGVTDVWKAVTCRAVPPCCNLLSSPGAAIAQTDPNEQDLLSYAVRHGAWLTVPQLMQIFQSRKWPYPGPSKGRKKRHFLEDMVNRLFPGDSAETKAAMVNKMAPSSRPKAEARDDDDCGDDLLAVISNLDPENADAAKGVRKACVDRLLDKQSESGPRAKQESGEPRGGWERKHFTPPELRSLLPPTSDTVWIKRQPAVPQYSGYYDRCWVPFSADSIFVLH